MDTFESAANTLKLLGHPMRLKIVVGLIGQPKCVKDIWGCLELPQPVVSQQLGKLKSAGIIEGRRVGVEMHYSVIDPMVKIVVEYLTGNKPVLS